MALLTFRGMLETMKETYTKPFIFVLMPFSEEFNDIYEFGIKAACESAGSSCERVDEQIFMDDILQRVYDQIIKADIIVAEMTGRNPNVFYETGYAHALGKSVVLLTQKKEDIPFDLQHYPHIVYDGKIGSLKSRLEEKIRWCIENFKYPSSNLISAKRVAQYLAGSIPNAPDNTVLKRKLRHIRDELDSIETGSVPFSYDELSDAEDLRITERLSNGGEINYCDIYIVESSKNLGFWGKAYSDYPNFARTIALQRQILDRGGSVTRLFIFEPRWLKDNLASCQDMIEHHNANYDATLKPITTLCALIRGRDESLRDDFSVLDEKEVFVWKRGSISDTNTFIGGQYVIAPDQVENYINIWRRLSGNALQFYDLSKLVT